MGELIRAFNKMKFATGEYIRANENGQMVVPEGAVVVAGSRPISKGPGAEQGIHLYCPVIVKYRDAKTSGSITLEDLLEAIVGSIQDQNDEDEEEEIEQITEAFEQIEYADKPATTETENGKKMIKELSTVCDQLKVAGSFAPHTEL